MSEALRLRLQEKEIPYVCWDTIEEPVVRLERNLHGHALAGLLCKSLEEVFTTQKKRTSTNLGTSFTSMEDHNYCRPYTKTTWDCSAGECLGAVTYFGASFLRTGVELRDGCFLSWFFCGTRRIEFACVWIPFRALRFSVYALRSASQ